MKKVFKIDSDGFYVEDIILTNDEQMPASCVEVKCEIQCYKPKWDGEGWVEGLTQVEIDTIKANVVVEPTIDEVVDELITTLVDKGVLF